MIKTKFIRDDVLGIESIEDELNKFFETEKIAPSDIITIKHNTVVYGKDMVDTVMLVYHDGLSSKPSSAEIGSQYVDNEGVHEWDGKRWIQK